MTSTARFVFVALFFLIPGAHAEDVPEEGPGVIEGTAEDDSAAVESSAEPTAPSGDCPLFVPYCDVPVCAGFQEDGSGQNPPDGAVYGPNLGPSSHDPIVFGYWYAAYSGGGPSACGTHVQQASTPTKAIASPFLQATLGF